MKKVLLLSLVLTNFSFAGTITNPKIDNRNNSKTYIGIGKNNSKGGGGKIYNDKITINHITSNNTKTNKTDKSTNNTHSKTKNNNFSTKIKTNINGLQKILTDIIY